MPAPGSLAATVCALVLAPLLLGIVNRTKSFVAGRRGPPMLQLYWDLAKYLRRGAVYGDTTSWLFRLGPVIGLAAAAAALLVTPFGGIGAPVPFTGDLIVLAGLFALGRFATVLAALDTGSSFEGMGASREMHFAALAEPALLLALATLAHVDGFPVADADLSRYRRRRLDRRAADIRTHGNDAGGADARRKYADSGRRSDHPSRTDDDPRSDGPRSQRAGSRPTSTMPPR